jgi:hypothetical protein
VFLHATGASAGMWVLGLSKVAVANLASAEQLTGSVHLRVPHACCRIVGDQGELLLTVLGHTVRP